MHMKSLSLARKTIAIYTASLIAFTSTAFAVEIHVMNSGGFSAAYRALAPDFESATKNTLVTAWGPSMGNTPEAIPSRLARGEPADVLIMVGDALDGLIKQGKAVAGSRVDLAGSNIGMVVRAGAAKPDISSVDAFKQVLLNAKSIAYSDSASGVYLSTVLFKRLGISDQIAAKSKMIPAEPVAAVVARGDAEIGFQQISELLPIPGAEVVGPLPSELQKVTVFAAGIATGAKQPEAGAQLIKYLASPAAVQAIRKSGLEPMSSH
jgi:molybdate transport system substrate-binding protein